MTIKQRIKSWLDLEPNDHTKEWEAMSNTIWKHSQLLEDRVKTTCPVCKKKLLLWPLEMEAYYTKDGKAYHVPCYESFTG